MDGWGILNACVFNCALLMKSFWWAITSTSIWNAIIRSKYIDEDILFRLSCHDISFPRKISAIWGSFKKILRYFDHRLCWQFRDGGRIPIGFQRILYLQNCAGPSQQLVHSLAHKGIHLLSHAIREWSFVAPIFKNANQLGLTGEVADEWDLLQNDL